MDDEVFVEIKVKFPNTKDEEAKTGLFKMPYGMDKNGENLMIDLVASGELIKSWLITKLAPED
jgi:hypothetical protein